MIHPDEVGTLMGAHVLVAVTAGSSRCACGESDVEFIEHLAEVALEVMGVPVLEIMPSDIRRTKRVLAELAERQERLGRELEATGLTGFIERSEWLIAHRTPDEQLAWDRAHAVPEPKRRRPVQVLPRDRQLELALGAPPRLIERQAS